MSDSNFSAIRARLRYESIEEFIDGYARFVSAGGMFIPMAATKLKPEGTTVRFQFLLADGTTAMLGEGNVIQVRAPDVSNPRAPVGMLIKFSKLSQESKNLVDQIVAMKEFSGLSEASFSGEREDEPEPSAPEEAEDPTYERSLNELLQADAQAAAAVDAPEEEASAPELDAHSEASESSYGPRMLGQTEGGLQILAFDDISDDEAGALEFEFGADEDDVDDMFAGIFGGGGEADDGFGDMFGGGSEPSEQQPADDVDGDEAEELSEDDDGAAEFGDADNEDEYVLDEDDDDEADDEYEVEESSEAEEDEYEVEEDDVEDSSGEDEEDDYEVEESEVESDEDEEDHYEVEESEVESDEDEEDDYEVEQPSEVESEDEDSSEDGEEEDYEVEESSEEDAEEDDYEVEQSSEEDAEDEGEEYEVEESSEDDAEGEGEEYEVEESSEVEEDEDEDYDIEESSEEEADEDDDASDEDEPEDESEALEFDSLELIESEMLVDDSAPALPALPPDASGEIEVPGLREDDESPRELDSLLETLDSSEEDRDLTLQLPNDPVAALDVRLAESSEEEDEESLDALLAAANAEIAAMATPEPAADAGDDILDGLLGDDLPPPPTDAPAFEAPPTKKKGFFSKLFGKD